MFKRSLNRAVLRLKVTTIAPLLIRAGDTGLDPSRADLSCVRTHHGQFGETVYIPGSSLKGVVRSAAEALVRREGPKNGRDGVGACDPLDHKASCGGRFPKKSEHETPAIYRAHCLACRTFGSTALKGRVSLRDLFPWRGDGPTDADLPNAKRANAVESRHGVGIDRITGGVRPGVLYDLEMIPPGVAFYGDIALENFQTWQLGLLVTALEELNDGFAQVGSTKSRGLGVVKVEVEEVLYEQPATAPERPQGIGKLTTDADRSAYGLLPEHDLGAAKGENRGLVRRYSLKGAEAKAWLEAALPSLREVSP